MRTARGIIGICLALAAASSAAAEDNAAADVAEAAETITVADLRKHVNVLASDTFEGRDAGSRGGKAASIYLGQQFRQSKLQGGGTGNSYYQEFSGYYRNVIALVKGGDPRLAGEAIVIGAHYDHVGYGNGGNSLGPVGHIHNGADDNASGTAAMLEIAEAFGRLPTPPARSVLFALWDGEEKGLLGSRHWISAPTIPLAGVRLLINMDMVGRLRNNRVEINGARTAAGLRRLVSENNRYGNFTVDFDWKVQDNSDHYPFYERRIPFVMPFTGYHEDYHRPSDDIDKLNLSGTESIARWIFATVHEAANAPELPRFREASLGETAATRGTVEAVQPPRAGRLAVTWSPWSKERGYTLASVVPGSAAEQAGLRPQDRVVKFGAHTLEASTDLQPLILAAVSPVTIEVLRAGVNEPVALKVPLLGPPARVGIAWREDSAEPRAVALTRVDTGSPAAKAGLSPNDRIYEINGRGFANGPEFRQLINSLPGPFEFLAERHGKTFRVQVPVESRSDLAAVDPK